MLKAQGLVETQFLYITLMGCGSVVLLNYSALNNRMKIYKLSPAISVAGLRMPVTEALRIRKETKEELNKLKVHPRETYDDVITRLIEEYKRCKGI